MSYGHPAGPNPTSFFQQHNSALQSALPALGGVGDTDGHGDQAHLEKAGTKFVYDCLLILLYRKIISVFVCLFLQLCNIFFNWQTVVTYKTVVNKFHIHPQF